MDELVSIIVPIYKTEKYLKYCVNSIRKQTYCNIEIILIDDGSPDNCGSICDSLVCDDARIITIHKKNGGLSDARNMGLKVASGKYIAFCDSDDWMKKDIIQTAITVTRKKAVEIVVWGYSADSVNENEKVLKKSCYGKEEYWSKTDYVNKSVDTISLGLLGYAWNKLYLKSTLKNIYFEKGVSLIEDILFNSIVMERCSNIVLIDTIGTHYIQRNNSTLGSAYYYEFGALIKRSLAAQKRILRSYNISNGEIRKLMNRQCLTAIKYGIIQINEDSSISVGEKIQRLRHFVEDKNIHYLAGMINCNRIKDKALLQMTYKKHYFLLLLCHVLYHAISSRFFELVRLLR